MRIASGMCVALTLACGQAFGGLSDTRTSAGTGTATVDGVLGANEYGPGNSYDYAGGGTGFGGTLGNGRLYMETDLTNLYVGIQLGSNLNDNVVLFMDTRAGGFTSSNQMDDSSDPGRARSSDPMSSGTTHYPIGCDYSLVIGSFGMVLFELQTNGSAHTFQVFSNTFTGNAANFREIALPLSNLGGALGGQNYIDFFAIYTSDSGFMSNESIPGNPLNGGGNPGFDNGGNALNIENWDRFQVPTPGTLALLGLSGLVAGRRRR